MRLKQVGIDRVGDAGNRVSGEQGAFLGQSFQPVAACYEIDVPSLIQLLLLAESPVGEVFSAAVAVDERTVATLLLIAGALAGMVADAGTRPHVVHGPYHGFARCKDFLDVLQRQHSLVYPVEMNDIRLLELRKRGNIRTCIGDVHGKDILLFEAVGFPYDDTLPYEFPYHAPVVV